MRPRLMLATLIAATTVMLAPPARCDTLDPAAQQIDVFDHALSEPSGNGTRTRDLAAAIDATFNIPIMAQFVVGPTWTQMSGADQQAIVVALRHYVTARFAHDLPAGDETITLEPAVETRGLDKLVRTQAVSPGDDPDHINYRLRAYDGQWRVIDIYYNGVSALTTQRADATEALQAGGATALAQRIESAAVALR
jgi:phospholipid transport system substrate-binding protein